MLGRRCDFQYGGKRVDASKLFVAMGKLRRLRVKLSEGFVGQHNITSIAYLSYESCYNEFRYTLQEKSQTNTWKKGQITKLLENGRYQAASNPKDAVYGIYGILQKLEFAIDPPDYSKSVEEIYIQTTVLAITHDNSLQILLQTCENVELPALPSWVPDWNTTLHHGISPEIHVELHYAVSKWGSPAKAMFLNKNMSLSVLGYLVDRVTRCSTLYIPSAYDKQDFPEFHSAVTQSEFPWRQLAATKAYQEWIDMARRLLSHPTGTSINEVFARTLLPPLPLAENGYQDSITTGYEPWLQIITPTYDATINEGQPSSTNCSRGESKIGDDENPKDTPNGEAINQEMGIQEYEAIFRRIQENEKAYGFNLCIYYCCLGTRLFITSSGYIGKGLREIQEGDYVALISGVSMPLILRQQGEIYQVKGLCHVEGIMKGEKWPNNEEDLVEIVLR